MAGDRGTWDASVVTPDQASAERADVLFTNLRTLRPEALAVRLTGARLALPPDRQRTLGAAVRVLEARLSWRLAADRAAASATVWLTLADGPAGPRLAGTDDGPSLDTSPQPLWWEGRTTRVDHGRATVLAGAGQDAERWAALADRAAAAVVRHLPRSARPGWDGRVVVEVPSDADDLARVLGASPAAYAQTAATTRPEGPTDAALRVVVNPSTAAQGDDEVGTLLTHETVHVATRSPGSSAPLWVVEGLAEHVALQAHPGQRAAELAALRGTPADAPGLPSDADLAAGGPSVPAAYARAWLACGALAGHRGDEALGRFATAVADGSSVDRAARRTLGVRGSTVERWGQDALRRALADGPG